MTKMKKLLNIAMAVLVFASMISFTGCGPSDKELAELDALRAEVKSLEKEINSLKSERTKISRELAEKKVKLDQCAKDKEITKENLKKIK